MASTSRARSLLVTLVIWSEKAGAVPGAAPAAPGAGRKVDEEEEVAVAPPAGAQEGGVDVLKDLAASVVAGPFLVYVKSRVEDETLPVLLAGAA